MSILQEVEKLLIGMTQAEKAQLLQWVVRDLGDAYSGVESQSQVCGGGPLHCSDLYTRLGLRTSQAAGYE